MKDTLSYQAYHHDEFDNKLQCKNRNIYIHKTVGEAVGDFYSTPKKETHRLQNGEYQLADLRPILAFFCTGSLPVLPSPSDGDMADGDATWLAGAVDRSSPGTGLVGDKLCCLCVFSIH